jgi:hypothetical protein
MTKWVIIGTITLLSFGCTDNVDKSDILCTRFAGMVRIGTNSLTVEQIFELINSYDLSIRWIYTEYESTLPIDSLEYVTDYLNSKDYINNSGNKVGVNWTINIDNQTGLITFRLAIMEMTKVNQEDWLETMTILQIIERPFDKSIEISVPIGQEVSWGKTFESKDNILFAVPSCYLEINPWP